MPAPPSAPQSHAVLWPSRQRLLAFTAMLLLAACASQGQSATAAPVHDSPAATPASETSGPNGADAGGETYDPATDTNTGTAVGQKVDDLRTDLTALDSAVRTEATSLATLHAETQAAANDYFNSVAAVTAKLQVGTTRGNPILVGQWNQAQAKLDVLGQDVGNLNALSAQIAGSASHAAYILQTVRATFGLSGAVDEDHVHLATLEEDVTHTIAQVDDLQNNVTKDLSRQGAYVSSERRNLQSLSLSISNGELYGPSLANEPYMANITPSHGARGGDAAAAGDDGHAAPTGRPLVVIRFDRDDVHYQHAVYQAVQQALSRYPQASFEVVAVTPNAANAGDAALASTAAKRDADGVANTLSQMGLPPGRIRMGSTAGSTGTNPEVRIFVR